MPCLKFQNKAYTISNAAIEKSDALFALFEFQMLENEDMNDIGMQDQENCPEIDDFIIGLMANVVIPNYFSEHIGTDYLSNNIKGILEHLQGKKIDFSNISDFNLYIAAHISEALQITTLVEGIALELQKRMQNDYATLSKREYFFKW